LSPDGSRRTEDTLKHPQAYYSLAQSSAERHCNAKRDVQDILPASASAGHETTGCSKRRRRPGPKRKDWMPNPFGKYPASSSVKKYVEATRHFYAPSTLDERARKTRYIVGILQSLGAKQSPRDITQENVLAFLDWMDEKGLEGSTKRKMLHLLGDYLVFFGNKVLQRMIARKMVRVPSDPQKEVRHIPPDVIERIHNATRTMDDWEGAVARFVTMAYPYTGLRPSEMRRIEYRDVDLANWTMTVRHPKGERSYGRQRTVGIPALIREVFADFLEERRNYLIAHGAQETAEPLMPYLDKHGKIRCWPYQPLRNLKAKVESASGVRFKLKDYRSSFCQIAIDNGAPLEAVSKVMGHKTTKTTESYYGRMRDEPAIAEIEKAFSKPSARNLIPPVLESSQ